MTKTLWRAIAIVASCFTLPALAEPRPLQIDDMFELESIGRYYGGPYSFSPDGKSLAFTRVRPKKQLANHKWEYLWGNAGGDIWVQSAPGATPVNLTRGVEDGGGWWSPHWSPDGEWLVMLSTRTGDNVTLWAWQKSTGALKQLTTRGVDLVEVRERPVLWIDDRHVLCPVLPAGEQPFGMRLELQTPRIASSSWPKVTKGNEVTSSVIESGVPVNLSERPQGQLLLIDVVDGSSEVIASSSTRGWRLSPSRKHVAYLRQVSVYTPKADEALPFGDWDTYTLEVRGIDGTLVKLQKELPSDVLGDSLRWSADGTELAFLGYETSRKAVPTLYRVKVGTGAVARVDLGDLDVSPIVRLLPQLEWTSQGDLIALGVRRDGDKIPAVTARRDWWLIGKNGSRRLLSGNMKTPPPEFWPQEGRGAFFGLADGELWRLHPASGKLENLTSTLEPQVTQLSWPILTNNGTDEYPRSGRTYTKAAVGVRNGAEQNYHLVDLASGRVSSMAKPAPAAELMSFEPRTGTAIFSKSDRQGLSVWRSSTGGTDEIVAANTFLRDVAEGEFKSIEYTSLNGEKLKAWLLLPVGYEPGRRYPVITWVYAGSVARDTPPSYQSIAQPSSLNMQLPAANGYAVLMPSMPLAAEGVADDPMLRLPDGVLPAVDKVIELGIADPDRVFLMGQSFGGFSTYGLVTQTKRFTAAVSLAGLSNLISLYSQFDARLRYTDHPQESLFQAALMESAQVRMGSPPWRDLGRYIRNSPVLFVDRVETPLMIVQGDLDYVALQQGEEFFMSLYRQGKRAKFVRYWGEGHVLESPANIRDMWRQVFDWFGSFPSSAPADANSGP